MEGKPMKGMTAFAAILAIAGTTVITAGAFARDGGRSLRDTDESPPATAAGGAAAKAGAITGGPENRPDTGRQLSPEEAVLLRNRRASGDSSVPGADPAEPQEPETPPTTAPAPASAPAPIPAPAPKPAPAPVLH